MEATHRTLQINSILFESNDPDVLVKGTVSKGHMTYSTDVLISNSQLNRLISQLQKQNEGLDFAELLSTEKMEENNWLYSADLSGIQDRIIDLDQLSPVAPLRQIRA